MANKKQYYGLDEIGFVGTQGKGTSSKVKRDIEKTIQFIKARKSGKIIPYSKKALDDSQRLNRFNSVISQ
jgi:hypothetical protein